MYFAIAFFLGVNTVLLGALFVRVGQLSAQSRELLKLGRKSRSINPDDG
jgi:hypothetical protein